MESGWKGGLAGVVGVLLERLRNLRYPGPLDLTLTLRSTRIGGDVTFELSLDGVVLMQVEAGTSGITIDTSNVELRTATV